MKNKFTLITSCLAAFAGSISAQTLVPAVLTDVNVPTSVTMPPANTGIAIGPDYDISAVVYDDPTASFYVIEWLDSSGNIQTTNGGLGGDPDVAYYSNIDVTVVAYNDWSPPSQVWVDDYYLSTVSPLNYTPGGSHFIDFGQGQNIDISSQGTGAICWENGGKIFASTFNVGPFSKGPTVYIGPGIEPDIAVHDNGVVSVTYIDNTKLIVQSLDYSDLDAGSATVLYANGFGPTAGGTFAAPRIAAPHNAAFASGNLDNFTVVSQEKNNVGGVNISGFFYDAGTMFPYVLVNDNMQTCYNNRPVVTYQLDKVVIAWASMYQSCGATITPMTPVYEDLIMGEFEYSGSNINGQDLFEVNRFQGGFDKAIPSISAKYDGNYPINSTSDSFEGIFYNNGGDLFWKSRDYNTFYRLAQSNQDAITSEPAFELAENPVGDIIRVNINTDSSTAFVLYNSMGQQIDITADYNSKSEASFSIAHLPHGHYFLKCISGNQLETLQVIH